VGSISDQTLAGIVTTATHGSGVSYGVISTHVLGLTMLLADGTFVSCSRHERPDLFIASLCGLGSTGLLLTIKMEVEPAFRLKEVQETMDFDYAVANIDELASAAEHVRLWWFVADGTMRVSSANRTTEAKNPAGSWLWGSLIGFHLIQLLLFLGRYFTSLNLWTGRFAAWLVRERTVGIDDGHAIFNVDCRYPQHTTEWAIPYENTQACLRELQSWLQSEFKDPQGLRPHFPIEVRFSAADDIWLSPSNGRVSCWIGIVQYKPYGSNVPYRKLFGTFENIVFQHGGRPHWAKAHGMRPEALRKMYTGFDKFINVLEDVDPLGLFRNEYVCRHLFGKVGPDVDERVFKPSISL